VVIGNGLRPEIWIDFKKRFDIPHIGEFYGSSEGNGGFANVLNFDCTVGLTTYIYAIVKYDIDEEKPFISERGFMKKVRRGEVGLLLFKSEGDNEFQGYTDKKATEEKLFRNVFKKGDAWYNTGDLMRDQGCMHAQFVDRLGDTFRWKGHNISTTQVEEVLNVFDQVLMSCVYGVKIPHTDGRAGMVVIIPSTSVEDFDLKGLSDNFRHNLPSYGIPIFLRFKSELEITHTFKLKKLKLKKEGFDFENIGDSLFVMLPGESEYTPLTKEIYENIQNQKYNF
jgi:citronellyl-CoA synthetase